MTAPVSRLSVNDVIMTPACRPETMVFSPLMLLPGTRLASRTERHEAVTARIHELLTQPGEDTHPNIAETCH
jgi:hypothetical protein